MSPSDEDDVQLCTVCHSLGIDMEKFVVRPSRSPTRRRTPARFLLTTSTTLVKLGTFEDISKRHAGGCSFCGLILASAETSPLLRSKGHEPPPGATCSVRWEVDGRRTGEVRDDGNYVQKQWAPEALTRRIRLRWDHKDLEDAHLVAIAQERYLATLSDADRAWSLDSLFFGRRIEFSGVNQARLNSWLDLCRDQHPHPCNTSYMESPRRFKEMLKHSYFGVIDVVNMQLVRLPDEHSRQDAQPAPYAALSYVWGKDSGNKKTFRTLENNINVLRMHGGLERFMPELPSVIRDTIDLVRRLNLRFVWIDALCIVQDSAKSWRLNAYNMDIIYGNAELTICAADGAESGLEAAKPSTNPSTQRTAECVEDLHLMLVRTPDSYIRASTWNTRAWTFQERLVSRRCLIFVDGRVFFQCPSTGMSENIYADRDGTGWSLDLVDAPMRMFKQMSQRSFWVYMNIAELYSSRKLTKGKDIYAAFYGITIRMKKVMEAPFIFGLPSSHLDLALLWQHTGPAVRREPKDQEESIDFGELRYPSWSWMGWTGPSIRYSHDMMRGCINNTSEWLKNHTWIRWYVRDGTGDLRPLWDNQRWRIDRSADITWRGYGFQRAGGAEIPLDYTERRNGWYTPFEKRHGAPTELAVGRDDSPSRSLVRRHVESNVRFSDDEVPTDTRVLHTLEHPPTTEAAHFQMQELQQSGVNKSGFSENNEFRDYRSPDIQRNEWVQRQYGPISEPTPTYTHSAGPHDTEAQRPQVQRQLTRQIVTFKDDASHKLEPERMEAEAYVPPVPYQASSQFLEARSTSFERKALRPNYSDRGLDLKPKYDDMFKPYDDVYPWHTESRPEFHISPKECPYPPIIHPYDGNLDSDPSRGPLMPLLQFWTWYAQLNIASRPKEAQVEADLHQDLERCNIADDNGDWCGSILLDRKWVKDCKDARQEFAAISEAKAFSLLECVSWTYYIPKERDESEWDVFYVLLIERKEEKWERVGLGKVFKEAFIRTAQWREIMLG